MDDFTITNYSLPLTTNSKTTLTTLHDESKDFTCVIDLVSPVTCVPLPLKTEDTLPVVMSANATVYSNGLATRPTSITQYDMSHKSPHSLIAKAMDWPRITSRTHLKPKDEYIKFLKDNMIINNRHYELYLSNYPYLANLETKISKNSLESLKRTIFRQNYLIIQNSNMLENRVNINSVNVKEYELGLVNFFLKQVADENQMSMESLKKSLGNWLFNKNHKKRGLILCGPSDTGKSFFANLLYGMYQAHEVGYFNCPTGPQPSSFMLQQLKNCLAYRCDKMIFENLGLLQTMKQLLEGSSTLHTDVKYKEPIKVDPRSVLITMNASYKNEIFKWHPQELKPFENRCLILFMGNRLINLLKSNEIEFLSQCSNVLYCILFKSISCNKEKEINLDKYIMYSQHYILSLL